ncbi:hypothetical protein PR048_012456 [Dryococelus australis]|uniref:Uncharacterized protein n=1 Tax=Dryococelus australis TaxID=614101 RepID=A0ABQ9HPG0_9NEOP|nr:hypothetical protein PR048_012456 [Dryococelus australis]
MKKQMSPAVTQYWTTVPICHLDRAEVPYPAGRDQGDVQPLPPPHVAAKADEPSLVAEPEDTQSYRRGANGTKPLPLLNQNETTTPDNCAEPQR